jgi:low affinity Fe/Cu permease
VVVAWVAAGFLLHFSPTWAQAIGTGTGIATFLMVLLIQSTQNRDSRAINLKLNELIRAMDSARNQLIDIERLSDIELDEMQATYEKIKTNWTARQARKPAGPQAE